MTRRRALYLTEFKHCACTQVHRRGEGLGYCRRHGHDKRRTNKLPITDGDQYLHWEAERTNGQEGFVHVG